ncbi:MAG: helix-turn-helix domain-containing protein, partial [Actinomycetota bacterium]|nr:helix-turn-helix domain-containing protein [Actinomycetota bacterium]
MKLDGTTLEVVDLGAHEQAIYAAVVALGSATTKDLADHLDRHEAQLRPVVDELLRRGLLDPVGGQPDRFAAAAPD